MKFRVVTALAALALSACGASPSAGLLESHIAKDTPANFVVCGNYGCSQRWDMLMTDAEWDQVRAIFAEPAPDPAAERQQMALAVGLIERMVGPKTGTANDKPGAAILTGNTRGQMDCIDEAHNTSVYLTLMERAHLLKWHKVGQPIMRGHVIDRWFHNTATVTDTTTGVLWVIDSWFGANGEPADIQTAALWLKGWEPEKYLNRTDR